VATIFKAELDGSLIRLFCG